MFEGLDNLETNKYGHRGGIVGKVNVSTGYLGGIDDGERNQSGCTCGTTGRLNGALIIQTDY